MVVVYRKASGLVGIDFFVLCLLGWGIARESGFGMMCGVEINLCREW